MKKVDHVQNIRIVPSLMKKAKVLKLKPSVIGNISNETFTPFDDGQHI